MSLSISMPLRKRYTVMTITEKRGDILTTTAPVIAHQVNCKGVMGAGLALQIKKAYPEVFKPYKDLCNTCDYRLFLLRKTGEKPNIFNTGILGCCLMTPVHDGRFIANLFGQLSYGRDEGVVYTDYEAVESALMSLRLQCEAKQINTIALPYGMGAGLAKGNWNTILGLITKTFMVSDFNIEIWRL